MKEELRKLVQKECENITDEQALTEKFLDIYKMLAEIMDRDFEHAWQIVIRSKRVQKNAS